MIFLGSSSVIKIKYCSIAAPLSWISLKMFLNGINNINLSWISLKMFLKIFCKETEKKRKETEIEREKEKNWHEKRIF